MKLLKNPWVSATVTAAGSLVYGSIFILTSAHLEFERILAHGETLGSNFWNGWSAFLRQGNLKWIGYIYLAAAACTVLVALLRKRRYDEYQADILTRSFAAAGAILLLLFPAALLLVLSDPNYAVEAVVLLVVGHWSLFLLTSLVYAIRWCRA